MKEKKYYGVASRRTGNLIYTGRGSTPAVYDNITSAKRTRTQWNNYYGSNAYMIVEMNTGEEVS